MLSQLKNIPPVQWAMRHPRLAAWIVLAAGMVILLAIEARDVGLLPSQWIALMVAAVLVAGACVWIISWEDEDEIEDTDSTETPPPSTSQTKE
ncbi:MAG: hypothetical protein CL610_21440 [Anaerolineaceae bacterium]|nr:hypothetical protein [Anaerolineaceae bacterium]